MSTVGPKPGECWRMVRTRSVCVVVIGQARDVESGNLMVIYRDRGRRNSTWCVEPRVSFLHGVAAFEPCPVHRKVRARR